MLKKISSRPQKVYRSFDDVLIMPKFCSNSTRDKRACLKTKLSDDISLHLPFISAAMDTVTECDMALSMALNGGIGCIHLNLSADEQVEIIKKVKSYSADTRAYEHATLDAAGSLRLLTAVESRLNKGRCDRVLEAGVDGIVIDTAHGHTSACIETIKYIKSVKPECAVIAGNVVTCKAASDLIDAGADSIKVGIGAGSICITRDVCGVGVPQFSAVIEVAKVCRRRGVTLISDGGHRTTGDIAKAIGAGANAVMLGNMLSSAEEAAGKTITVKGKRYKSYRGMGSKDAIQKSDRYHLEGGKAFVQGVSGLTAMDGKGVKEILFNAAMGVKQAMFFSGVFTLDDFMENCTFIFITSNSALEGKAHSITMLEES